MAPFRRTEVDKATQDAIDRAGALHRQVQLLDDERRGLCAERRRAVQQANQGGASFRMIAEQIGLSPEAVRKLARNP